MDKKPEAILPMDIVEDYQSFRSKFINETGSFMDALRMIESAKEMPENLVNEIGRQLLDEFVPLRKHMLGMMEDYLRTMADAHLAIQQLNAVSEKYNELVEALEHGDLTHDLTDVFLQEVHNDLENEWTDELNKAVARENQVSGDIAASMVAALEGAHVPIAQRPTVAKAIMYVALRMAGKLPDAQPELADGMEAEIVEEKVS